MKLRRLSSISLAGALLGLLLLGAFGIHAWNNLSSHLERVERLSQLRGQVEQLNVAIDYITLLRSDPLLLEALAGDALGLAESFRELDHPISTPAIIHLNEIAHLGDTLSELAPNASLIHGDLEQRNTLMAVGKQMLVHRAGINDVINAIFSEQQQLIYREVMGVVAALLTLALALALAILTILGFTIIHSRLSAPLKALENGLRAVAAGDLEARIQVTGQDELAELSDLFNRMVEQRGKHEHALQEEELRFRQLAENIDEVFWMTDPHKQTMLYVSPAFERIWGIPCETLYHSPESWLRAIHEEDRDRVLEALPQQTRGSYKEEYRICRPDGSQRCILDRAFPIRDDHGEVYRIAGVALDLTDRRKMETDLQERVKELSCLQKVLELTTDQESSEAAVCADVATILPMGFADSGHAVARVVVGERECTSPNWESPEKSIQAPIRVDGKKIGLVEVGYRSSRPAPIHQHQAFLPEEWTLLEAVAQHLARMLHTRQMAQAMAQSERLSAVGQLTGGVAHDFNNLLTVIIGNSELLQLRLDQSHPLHSLVDMIASAAQRGADLTQRLLAFSRSQALEPRVIDVNQLLENMHGLLERSLGEHIELRIYGEDRLWPALVDPGQLENAILNLCINARDAMPQGGRITLETTCTRLDQHYAEQHLEVIPGEYVQISVSDTGEGIPAQLLDKVFEPFFTTKGERKGTGLGLSMVHGFVKQSRGHISIYSEIGEGTTVRLYLPRAMDNEHTAQLETPDYDSEGGSELILMVEDDAMVRRYAEEQLINLGYTVLVASSPREALTLIQEHPDIDLLFTDVVMPGGMNGRQLAEAARAHRPDLKVLYTSGYTRNAIVHDGRLDPGVLMLAKPYRQAELAAKIREALQLP